jgi:hypothetical protein
VAPVSPLVDGSVDAGPAEISINYALGPPTVDGRPARGPHGTACILRRRVRKRGVDNPQSVTGGRPAETCPQGM